ncbi:MAG: ABC transporter permease [Planctomycetaceae bacterium]|nr:ABC transporter permease [Planctomycetaceae bacterium]
MLAQESPSVDSAWPVTVIEAARPAGSHTMRELLRYRDLLLILALRDLQVRYRQAIIGIAWAVIRPAATVIVFVLLFGLLDRKPVTTGVPYAATALVGLLTWQLYATLLADMSESLVKNRHMLTKVYFPRVLIPIAATAVGLVDYLVALVPALAFLLLSGIRPDWQLLLTPLWLCGVLSWSVAGGILLSAINARYRDVEHVIPFLLQLGFFASPVVYETAAIIPVQYQGLYRLNPMAVMLDGLRWSLVGAVEPNWFSVWIATGVTLTTMFFAWRIFHRLDASLVDRI